MKKDTRPALASSSALNERLREALSDLLSWFGPEPSGTMQATFPNGLPAWCVVKEARALLADIEGPK